MLKKCLKVAACYINFTVTVSANFSCSNVFLNGITAKINEVVLCLVFTPISIWIYLNFSETDYYTKEGRGKNI